jgi:hypothetical protein
LRAAGADRAGFSTNQESIMTDASHGGAAKAQQPLTFKEMTPRQKFHFVLKVVVCVLTFGFVFPNVMSD